MLGLRLYTYANPEWNVEDDWEFPQMILIA